MLRKPGCCTESTYSYWNTSASQRCLRSIMGIHWQDCVTNVEVLEWAGLLKYRGYAAHRHPHWVRHVLRINDTRMPKSVSTRTSWSDSLHRLVWITNTGWFAPVIEGLLYVEDFTTNWFLRTWPYMEFICTCSSIVNWKIKLIWQRRLLHMSISVEATGKILYLQFVFHMRLVSFEVRSVVTLLKCKLRNELLGF